MKTAKHASTRTVKHTLKQRGFTTIEIVLVLVIIGILGTLVITTRAGVQENQRNTERQRDIKELRDGLEGYFANANQYPTLANLNDSTWRTTNLKALEPATFQDPSDKTTPAKLVDKPAPHVYTYSVTSASGAPCGSATVPCTQYTLTATLEGGGTYTKSNLN
jgi:prepilin-type N-terminal cleavage/methylation domain-containing protein